MKEMMTQKIVMNNKFNYKNNQMIIINLFTIIRL